MGALCSKNFDNENDTEVANPHAEIVVSKEIGLAATPMRRSTKKRLEDNPDQLHQESVSIRQIVRKGSQNDSDYLYDGIPRIPAGLSQKSRSMKSTQAKVSEVGSLLGKAGTMGFGKAVEVLDVLGSSMTDLHSRSGFVSGGVLRGTKVSILAFEVANTVVKGCKLINSVSEKRITHLKEVVLPSQGVQKLISKDMDQLLKIVARDKREELELFSAEVVRFGNRCKDPQWHNLERYFQRPNLEIDSQNLVLEEMESMMNQLMSLVQCTSELYHELHSLDRFEQEYHCKQKDEGEDTVLRSEIKKQKKLVKNLKKRSLWSRSLEEVIEKLVDIVLFVRMRILDNFNTDGGLDNDTEEQLKDSGYGYQKLGPAGLALHYANMILQIDGIVARSTSMTLTARDSLYQSLPPSIKSTLRSKLHTFPVKEEIGVPEIKVEMEKTLQWLVPMATNTVKSHHGFGWVGEWANAGLDRASTQNELVRVDTLYHTDKVKTETYITNQLLWLHHLIQQSRSNGVRMTTIPSFKPSPFTKPSSLTKDQNLLLEAVNSKRNRSKSEDLDTAKDSLLKKNERLSKSRSHSTSTESKVLSMVDLRMENPKPLESVETVLVIG